MNFTKFPNIDFTVLRNELNPETPALFGSLNAQQMIEHVSLIYDYVLSNNKVKVLTPADKIEKVKRAFLWSEGGFKRGITNEFTESLSFECTLANLALAIDEYEKRHLLVAIAIKEVEQLRNEFPELGLICINTLKPFGDKNLFERLKKAKIVITYENHLISSGLAKAVALHIAQNPGPKLMPIGVDDTFTHGGTQDYLFNYYGIGKTSLISAIYEAFGKSSLKSESNTDMNKSEILLNKSVAEGL